jgi:hypothetical protein
LKGSVGGPEFRRAIMPADGLIGGEPPVPDGLDGLRDELNALDDRIVSRVNAGQPWVIARRSGKQ